MQMSKYENANKAYLFFKKYRQNLLIHISDALFRFHTTGNGLCDTPEVYETAELFYVDNYFKMNIITYSNTGL